MPERSKSSSAGTSHHLDKYDLLFRVIIGGLATSILLLAIDLYRESNLHQRITELEREMVNYRKEKDKILDCFSVRNYWQYKDCF